MAFTLLVCAEVGRQKLNLEIPFDEKPTLSQLHATIDAVFDFEQQRRTTSPRRGAQHPQQQQQPFALTRAQIYSDEYRQWVDLVSSSQLHPYDQLYVYQRYGADDDVGGGSGSSGAGGRDLPPPITSTYFTGPIGQAQQQQQSQQSQQLNASGFVSSPPRGQSRGGTSRAGAAAPASRIGSHATTSMIDAADAGETVRTFSNGEVMLISAPAEAANLTTEDKMRVVFEEADPQGNGYVTLPDFRELFNETNILFNRATVDEIFRLHALTNPSFLNFVEFVAFCRAYPVTFTAAFTRIADRRRVAKMEREIDGTAAAMEKLRRRRDELQRELEATQQQLADVEGANRRVAGDLSAHLKHRQQLEEEEQVLLDKEVRVAYQREVLRREEADFVATARRFDLHVEALQPNVSAAIAAARGGQSPAQAGSLTPIERGSNPSPYSRR